MTTQPLDGASVRPVGRLGPFFASIWLFFLIQPLSAGIRAHDAAGWAGATTTVVFGAVYMSVWLRARARGRLVMGLYRPTLPESTLYLGTLIALGTLMMLTLGEPGIAAVVYIAVAAVLSYRLVVAAPIVLGVTLGTVLLGLVPGWGSQVSTAFAVMAASVAVFGIRGMVTRNAELVDAQRTNAELAVENERSRFARDLHDILGHSLTVITVKAELARRVFDDDPERARAELNDLERLSRDALVDVRRAVEGYRQISLTAELVRAREALRAAEIEPQLPNTTDDVPSDLRELFAWTVREGITNVIRHSSAARCEVRFAADRIEISDDGTGDADGFRECAESASGAGLKGLRERAAAAGATVVTRRLDPGWMLTVVLAGGDPSTSAAPTTPAAQPGPASTRTTTSPVRGATSGAAS